jgi:tripartite ATP-independent transporter DctP family solute receptor
MKKGLAIILTFTVASLMATGCTAKNQPGNNTSDAPAAGADATYTMKLADAAPPGDYREATANEFARLVSEKSGGRVTIEVYAGGTLGDWRDTIEGLSMGLNEIVIESLGTLDTYSPKADIDAIPYLYSGYEHFRKVWDSDLGKQILKEVGDDSNFVMLGSIYRGARVVTSVKSFTDPAGVKGLKMRVPNIEVYIKTWERLGAIPTPLAGTEIFTALQQGTVDAQENPILTDYSLATYDVCPYVIKTNHVYSMDTFIFDEKYFNDLPADIQQILKESADEASKFGDNYVLEKESACEQQFKDKGCQIIEVDTKPFMDVFNGFTEEVFPALADWANQIRAME